MRVLVAVLLLLAAGSAEAQYVGNGSPYPPGTEAPAYPPAAGQPYQGYTTTQPGGTGESLAQALLEPQNEVRTAVGDPPMRWSDRLADAAQDWANRLIATGQFVHRPDNPYGENLYEMLGGTASPDQVVATWADEVRNYDRATNTCTGVCGHYTQIVWRATRNVGCAVVGNASREVWVCEYDPAGNVVGYRPY